MTDIKNKLPGEAYSKNIRARFWITGEHSGYVGIGRIELLEKIGEFGSMNKAAKSMGMSYKKAWKLVQELNDMYNEPLVVKEVGGKSGGGSQLTAKGNKLVANFRQLEVDLQQFLEQASKKL